MEADTSSTALEKHGSATDPYRIFFPLGILLGIAGVSIWPLYYWGVTAGYSGRSHAFVQPTEKVFRQAQGNPPESSSTFTSSIGCRWNTHNVQIRLEPTATNDAAILIKCSGANGQPRTARIVPVTSTANTYQETERVGIPTTSLKIARKPNATHIVPELQNLKDWNGLSALAAATDGFTLMSFDPEHFLVLAWKTPDSARPAVADREADRPARAFPHGTRGTARLRQRAEIQAALAGKLSMRYTG